MMGKGASKACILKAIKYYSLSDVHSEAPAKAKPLYGENGELLGFTSQYSWYNWDDEYEWKNFSKHYIHGLAEYAN
jgi:hypothetical protein